MTRSTSEDIQEKRVVIRGTLRVSDVAEEASGEPGEIPTAADKLWISRIRTLSEDSLKALGEGAKSIMTACTFFITVYTFLLSEATDKSRLVGNCPLAFAAPIVFFALSMVAAVLVVLPLRYETNEVSVTRARDTWLEIARDKYRALTMAFIFLALGLFTLIVSLVIYLGG